MFLQTTILFEDPFWVAYVERTTAGEYSVSRIVFGKEPGNAEVHEFFLNKYREITFSVQQEKAVQHNEKSHKRRIREAGKATGTRGVSTKAQRALAAEREKLADQRKTIRSEKKQEARERLFSLKTEKRKQKRRGH